MPEETISLRQAWLALNSIEDERLQNVAKYAFWAALTSYTRGQDTALSNAYIDCMITGNYPADLIK